MRWIVVIATLLAVNCSYAASGGWSWNLGYHNPPGATLGLNFMHLWSNWAVELGIGSLGSTSSTNSSNSNGSQTAYIGGDVNLKYLFSSGTFRPYLQGGLGLGTTATTGSNGGVSAGTGSGFLGGGIFLMGNPFYFYIGVNFVGGSSDLHLGLGFDL